jgi:hypothetical protein
MSAQCAPGVRGEGREELELTRPEMYGTAITQQFAGFKIQNEALRDRQPCRPTMPACRSSSPGPRVAHDGIVTRAG